MRARPRMIAIALFIAVGSLTAGCHYEPGPITPVTGRVTYKGEPLHGGHIVFAPDAGKGERGPIAYGKIDENGNFTLMTGDVPGVHAGRYRVAIGPMALEPNEVSSLPELSIADKYSNPELSQISCQVKANEANSFHFDLQ